MVMKLRQKFDHLQHMMIKCNFFQHNQKAYIINTCVRICERVAILSYLVSKLYSSEHRSVSIVAVINNMTN